MTHKFTRILCVCLAVLMLASVLVACGKGEEGAVTTTTASVSNVAVTTTEVTTKDPQSLTIEDVLPANLDLKDTTIRFVCKTSERANLISDTQTGEILNDAIFDRNFAAMEKYHFKMDVANKLSSDSSHTTQIQNIVLAGDNAYDVISGYQAYAVPLAIKNCYYDVEGEGYFDFDNPWWSQMYMNEIRVNSGVTYFMAGDIDYSLIAAQDGMFINKDMYEDRIGPVSELYDTVRNGKWTVERLHQLSNDIYTDLNGNGQKDLADVLGFSATTVGITEHFTYASGYRTTVRGDDGYPVLTLGDENCIKWFEMMYSLYYENDGAYIFTYDDVPELIADFCTGNRLFFPMFLGYAVNVSSDAPFDYGIIPFPKRDEDVENYCSLVHDSTNVFCIPITSNTVETTSAALEALAAEGRKYITPAYFDLALKYRYSTDADSAEMIGLIHSVASTDFLYAYNYAVAGNPGLLCRSLMKSQTSDFNKYYKPVEKMIVTKLASLIEDHKASIE